MGRNTVGIIRSVTKPLQFLVLTMLVMESLLAGLAWKFTDLRSRLAWAIIAFILIFIGVGVIMEVVAQRAGTWLPPYAALFAEDLLSVLDGYLVNLSTTEQREAWASLADVLLEFEDPGAPRAYIEFRLHVAERLKKKLGLKKPAAKTQGPID